MLTSHETFISSHLGSGEVLLWSGQPRTGIVFRPQDAYIIPFSILWCGFAIFWETMVIKQGAPFFFMLWGIPFVLIGLFFVFGRFFADAYTRGKTFYGVTSERIIISRGFFTQQLKSLSLRTLTDVSLTQKSDGSGTITFGSSNMINAFFPAGAWPGAGRYAPPSFDLIDDAKSVYDIIRSAQKAELKNG